VEWAAFGVRQAIRLHKLTRTEPRRELSELLQQLEDMLLATSELGTQTDTRTAELGKDDLTVAEAAEILDCSPEWVRRIADDLGGWRHGWQWVIPRQNVIDYANSERSC
jgi:hypothetical protein